MARPVVNLSRDAIHLKRVQLLYRQTSMIRALCNIVRCMQHLTTETLGPLSHYAIKSDTEAFGHFRSKCLIRQFLIILSDIFSYMMQNMPSLKLHHLKYL